MEPIRVAQVMGYMNGGGVESVVMNYYRHIDREKVQFDFIVCEGSTLIPREEIERLGGRVFIVPNYNNLPRYIEALKVLFTNEDWQIVHSHMNSLSVFPLFAAKKAGVPVRISHSHSTSGKGEYAKNAAKMFLKRFSNAYSTERWACGDYAGRWLFGNNAEFEIIPNAIDFTAFKNAGDDGTSIRESLGLNDSALVVGHVGRFVKQKNHGFLLRVFQELLSVQPDAYLVLVGTGELLDMVKLQAEDMGIAEHVRFLGRRSDTARLYAAFDVFCLPSLYEGLPVVGVESQAARVPLVVSSEVSSELMLSRFIKFEKLSAGPAIWAQDLLEYAGKQNEALPELGQFDLTVAAPRLVAKYERLSRSGFGALK